MSLYVIGTPIGNEEDLAPRARRTLQECDWIVGEERKVLSKRLRGWGLQTSSWRLLNEHSTKEDLNELFVLCRDQTVALITDCGTPGFCDPGADLVRMCRQNQIPVRSIPGPSSLTTFLSLTGYQLAEFHFVGFLPANRQERDQKLNRLKTTSIPLVLMDTPYRLQKTLEDMQKFFPKSEVVLGLELSKESERILEGSPDKVLKQLDVKKSEFLLLVFP